MFSHNFYWMSLAHHRLPPNNRDFSSISRISLWCFQYTPFSLGSKSLFRAENGGYGTPSFQNFSLLLLHRWEGNHLRNVFIHGKQCLVLWFRKLLDRGGGPASMKSYSYGVIATKFHATARIISSWHGSATRNTGTFKIERHKSRCFFCFMDGKQLLYFYIFRVD